MEDNDEVIKLYFKRNEWDKFTDIERARYRNMYKMYNECLSLGIDIPKPDFMQDNKENVPKNGRKKDSPVRERKKKKKIVFKFPHKKYPKRKLPPVNYKEEGETLVDSYIYCDTCEEEYEKFCPKCGMLIHIFDKEVRAGVKNRAKKTLPPNLLEIKKSPIHGEGVFALKTIPKGIKFGPYEGLEAIASSTGYAWKIRGGKLVDGSKVEYSNWLRYVNCARNVSEQNLVGFQFEGKLYYRSVTEINKGEELLIFYGEQFAKLLNIDPKRFFEPPVEPEEEKVYACVSCCLGFSAEEFLKRHLGRCPYKMPERELPSADIVMCPFCKIHFSNAGYWRQHIRYCRDKYKVDSPNWADIADKELSQGIEEFRKECKFKCMYCNYQTNCHTSLIRHLRIHTGEKPFPCTICNKSFTERGHLKTHLRIHTGEKPFRCSICNKSFTRRGDLKYHLRVHAGEKPFRCSICNNSFAASGTLKKHLRIHTGEKPFPCTICNKSFTERGHLKTHLRIHTGEKPFRCSICNKSFTQRGHLKYHLRVHAGEKPFRCTICNKSFIERGHLKTHLRIHTGEKPFRCTICNKSFIERGHLKTHLRIHTGEKPFRCTICNKSFTRRDTLKKHLRIHIGEKPRQFAICRLHI